MYNGSFYNPYMFGSYQAASNLGRTGLGLKGLFRGFNFSNFLTSTGKTLNVINQAIPIFYQVKPIFNNAKTMLRVVGAVRDSKPKTTYTNTNTINQNHSSSTNINTNTNANTNTYSPNNNSNVSNTNDTPNTSRALNNPAFFLYKFLHISNQIKFNTFIKKAKRMIQQSKHPITILTYL